MVERGGGGQGVEVFAASPSVLLQSVNSPQTNAIVTKVGAGVGIR